MKCLIKTQSGMSAYETTLRDLDAEEMCDFVAKSCETAPVADVPMRVFVTEHGDGVCVAALTTCSKSLPISYRLKGVFGKEYVFRGNVAICGCKELDPADLEITDEIRKRYPVEPIYKDDAVCIPSLTEWLMLPEDMRKAISPTYWVWTRTESKSEPGEIEAVFSTSDQPYLTKAANDDSGGVTPFINLRKIDEEMAGKMRKLMGDRHEVILSSAAYNDLFLVKVSDNVYACASHGWEMETDQSGLMPFDENRRTSYEDSTLRAFPEQMMRRKYTQQGGVCACCGKPKDFSDMQGDHITPWSRGGKTVESNLQMLCKACNAAKSNG